MASHWDILTGIKAAIQALPSMATVQVRLRKRLFFGTDHGDTYRMVCLAPSEEIIAEETTPNLVWIDFPVLIAIFQKQGATLQNEAELQWQIERREEIRLALWKPDAPAVAGVFDVDYNPAPVFDLAGLDKSHDISLQRFIYRHSGPRSA